MGLKERLKSIFKGEDDHRIKEMIGILKEIKVFTEEDLDYLDKDILKSTEYFKEVEIKKLLCAKPGAKKLREKLEEIFVKVDTSKISRIEAYFDANEVYTSEDLALYDLETLAKENSIFTDLDVNKIKNYIRKEFPDKFSEIGKIEDHNRAKDALMFQVSMKKKELEEERKSKTLENMHKTKEQLLRERQEIQSKLADLMICQTNNSQNTSRRSTGPMALPAGKMDARVAAGVVCVMAVEELVSSGLAIYSNVSQNVSNESNKELLEKKLQQVNKDLAKVDEIMDNFMDGQACLTSSSATLAIEDKPE